MYRVHDRGLPAYLRSCKEEKSKRWIRKAAGAQIVSSRLDSGFSAFTLNDMDAFEGFLKWEGHDLTCILMSSIWLPA